MNKSDHEFDPETLAKVQEILDNYVIRFREDLKVLETEKLKREIESINLLIAEIEFAIAMEENPEKRNGLSSALGQLRSARTWLVKILKGL